MNGDIISSQTRLPIFRISQQRGQMLSVANRQITPIANLISFRLGRLLISWSRPIAVEVRQEEHVERLPISNVTRQIITGMLLISFLTAAIVSWLNRRRK